MNDTVKALTETVGGRVIAASDPDYDDARAVYNAMHDRRPLAVVRCTDTAGVMAVVAAARDTGVDPFPALQSAFDDLVPRGVQHYWKADLATELPDEAIAAHVEHGKSTPNVSSSMHLHVINGAARRVGADETAFGHRDTSLAPVIVGIWPDPADDEADTTWVRDYYAATHPHSRNEGGYINSMSGDVDHRAAANYGADDERLSAVEAACDPDDLFHVTQNITPAKEK